MEVTGHKAHGPVPEPGSMVIARVRRRFAVYSFLVIIIGALFFLRVHNLVLALGYSSGGSNGFC